MWVGIEQQRAAWLVILYLILAGIATAAPGDNERPMPNPCTEAPNLPFCE